MMADPIKPGAKKPNFGGAKEFAQPEKNDTPEASTDTSRVNFEYDAEKYRQLKIFATQNGYKIKELLTIIIDDFLKHPEKK